MRRSQRIAPPCTPEIGVWREAVAGTVSRSERAGLAIALLGALLANLVGGLSHGLGGRASAVPALARALLALLLLRLLLPTLAALLLSFVLACHWKHSFVEAFGARRDEGAIAVSRLPAVGSTTGSALWPAQVSERPVSSVHPQPKAKAAWPQRAGDSRSSPADLLVRCRGVGRPHRE